MPHYGADLVDARVAVDGNIISAAGVAAGLDAALVLVSLLRGDTLLRKSNLQLNTHRTPFFKAELRTLRRPQCSRASGKSTSR
jgi:transcriptional regulator GlxA family with amidase domain